MTNLNISSEQFLNEEKVSAIEINLQAPVVAIGEIKIRATPETAWEIMADIDRWPEWNPDVESATLTGELTPGSTFQWKAGPGMITSTLRRVERPSVIAWTGKMLEITAVHVWNIKKQDGFTIVKTEESWDGLLLRLFSGMMQKALDQSINQGLEYLKVEAEKRNDK